MTRFRTSVLFPAALLAAWPLAHALAQKDPIRITADLTDAPRKVYHAEVDLPVAAGPLALTTPKWIPGNHRPTGPADEIAGVVFTIDGKPIAWRRDDVDLYQYHLTIPAGATRLHAHLDCIVTERVTQKLAVLEWEKLLLYPANTPVRDIPIQPSLKVPDGWGVGTALTPAGGGGGWPVPAAGSTTQFEATNVEQLEDSPVIAGQNFREYALAPTVTPKHFIDVVSDQPAEANLRPEMLAAVNNLVREADALYGSHHYHVYHFLLTLSDVAGVEGLEHGQSSDNGVDQKGYADDAHQLAMADLLSHEFTHSWNGKYRRPAGLYQPDFATAQQGALLWVYEGMTQYLGNVLAARSNLKTQAQYRDMLAMSAASLDHRPGRDWRSTGDTAVAASILRGNTPWYNLRRGQDYYEEGELLWLDADTLIRKMSDNKKSLDDFQKIFLGKGGNTGPEIVPYTFDELAADLNQVVKYDWAGFLHDRVDKINPRADVAGIERGGYKLVYKEKPNASESLMAGAAGKKGPGVDAWFSIGLEVEGDGEVGDVLWGGPAYKAKMAPGQKIIAANGQVFSPDALREAIKDSKGRSEPIHLIVQAEQFVYLIDIDYHDGERYPVLERAAGAEDYLDEITKPLTKQEKAPETKTGESVSM